MEKRLLELGPTGLFGEEAILTSLTGHEELSKPFDFMLSIASPKVGLTPDQVIGQPISVRIDRGEEAPRFVHGYVNSFWAGNTVSENSTATPFREYRVRLVPWLWFLSRAARCFVYLPEKDEKSIQDVLDEMLKRVKSYGHIDPVIESSNAKILKSRKVEHCVQYRETDFNFLSRTLEQYGVYYYFKHTESKHTMILSDQRNYPNAPEKEVRYPGSLGGIISDDVIESWSHSYEFVSGKWEQTDYDFIHPSTNLKVNAKKHASIPLKNNSAYELYDYPGEYIQKDDGEVEAAIRLEEEESGFDVVAGTSACKSFSPGYCFKLTEHPTCKEEKGKSYLITSVSHSASQPGPFSSNGQGANYSNSFSCIPRDSQFRPARLTPQPILSSVQTAIVVGPSGEEIYTDKYGRVKVQFYWDREGKKNESTCCWTRVSQQWAGQGWGGMQIPHIGHEVVVAFLEGDPDRPLIVGRVYNAEQGVPMPLPAEKTRSVLRDYGGNETVMEGAKGKQFIHTQQTCGNEFLMDGKPGQEKIVLRDKYGNEIILDAVEGTISIYSPSHESGIVLGRSIKQFTLSDLLIKVEGNTGWQITKDWWFIANGSTHETTLGLSSLLIGGLKHETVVGVEAKLNVAAKLEFAYALQVMITAGKRIEQDRSWRFQKSEKIHEKIKEFYKMEAGTDATILAKKKLRLWGKEAAIVASAKEAVLAAKKVKIAAKSELDIRSPTVKISGNLDVKGKITHQNGTLVVKGSPGPSPENVPAPPGAQDSAAKKAKKERPNRGKNRSKKKGKR